MLVGEPDGGELDRQDQRRGGNERNDRSPGWQSAQPALEARDRRPLGQSRHRLPEIVQQDIFDEDYCCRHGHEQQFEGTFEVAFHDTANLSCDPGISVTRCSSAAHSPSSWQPPPWRPPLSPPKAGRLSRASRSARAQIRPSPSRSGTPSWLIGPSSSSSAATMSMAISTPSTPPTCVVPM